VYVSVNPSEVELETYKAKNASDGLEHGSWDRNIVAEHVVQCADGTHFERLSILELVK
jgi:hypothetical protein